MAGLTRRGFIKHASVSAAAVGVLAAGPGLSVVQAATEPHNTALTARELQGPIVAHIRNVASGEIAVMVGTREIIVHDRELVSRLIRTAR